jgi:ABC-2 type transport system ATP-binding protein
MNTITLRNIYFGYDNREELLTNVNLDVAQGRIHGLFGKNGEGKSTLLKLMAGLLYPNKNGRISALGRDPQKRHPELLREIYFLPEEMPSYTLTLARFEKLYAPLYPRFDATEFARYLVGFEIFSKDWIMNRLSHGQQKKVLTAFALATHTKILLMDEPTNGMDIPSKTVFRRMVASSLDQERSIIISTHQIRDLEHLIDNVIIMSRHNVALHAPLETIAKRLLFRVRKTDRPDNTVIYSEDSMQGVLQVCENRKHEESRLDMELLFNAVCHERDRIQTLFTPKQNTA